MNSVPDFSWDIFFRFAKAIFWKKSTTPEYVIFQATSRCNVKCLHCFLWEGTGYGWENTNQGKFDLSLDEIRKISNSMADFYFLNVTGGEPFLRADLPSIVEIFYRNNRVRDVLIPTNGTATRLVLGSVREILESCPRLRLAVSVSLDGSEILHDRIRASPGTYSKAIETFSSLKELQKSYRGLQVGVILAMMNSNQETAGDFYEHVRDTLKPDSFAVALVRGNALDPKERDVNIVNYEALTSRIERDLKSGRTAGYRTSLLSRLTQAAKIAMYRQITQTVRKGFQTPCYAGQLNVVIFSNGDVYPCEVLGPDKKLGNLREAHYDFRRLWDSSRRHGVAEWIIKSRCHCTHECHIPVNLLFNPRRAISLIPLGMRLAVARAG